MIVVGLLSVRVDVDDGVWFVGDYDVMTMAVVTSLDGVMGGFVVGLLWFCCGR